MPVGRAVPFGDRKGVENAGGRRSRTNPEPLHGSRLFLNEGNPWTCSRPRKQNTF
jgi:hypothetical protein